MPLFASQSGLRVTMVTCAILFAGLIAFAGVTGLRGAVGDMASTLLLLGIPLLSAVSLAAVVVSIFGGLRLEPMPATRFNIACIACGMLVVVAGGFAGVAYAFE